MLTATRLLTLTLTVAGLFAPLTISTQTPKAALTKNVDERGRVPYHSFGVQYACDGTTCAYVFQAVPAGSRLVITHASGYFFGTGSGVPVLSMLRFANGLPLPGDGYYNFIPTTPVLNNKFVLNSETLFFVEPGQTPYTSISDIVTTAASNSISLSGYLVSLD